jgi:glutathione S-transferase
MSEVTAYLEEEVEVLAHQGRPHGAPDIAKVVKRPQNTAQTLPGVTMMEIEGQGVMPNRYYTVKEALNMRGVRWSGVPESPAPVSEPLKQMLWIKRIPAARVIHPSSVLPRLDDPINAAALEAGTAQSSWPVLWADNERPRSCWLEQLELVERLGAPGTPKLYPANPAHHVTMVGMVHLIMGERGFFWMRRLLLTIQSSQLAGMTQKYSFEGDFENAPARVAEVLRYFDEVLQRQEEIGSRYLVGHTLTAADIYWALTSMVAMAPSEELIAPDLVNPIRLDLPTPDLQTARQFIRNFQDASHSTFAAAVTQRLRDHQDYIIRTYCNVPLK